MKTDFSKKRRISYAPLGKSILKLWNIPIKALKRENITCKLKEGEVQLNWSDMVEKTLIASVEYVKTIHVATRFVNVIPLLKDFDKRVFSQGLTIKMILRQQNTVFSCFTSSTVPARLPKGSISFLLSTTNLPSIPPKSSWRLAYFADESLMVKSHGRHHTRLHWVSNIQNVTAKLPLYDKPSTVNITALKPEHRGNTSSHRETKRHKQHFCVCSGLNNAKIQIARENSSW